MKIKFDDVDSNKRQMETEFDLKKGELFLREREMNLKEKELNAKIKQEQKNTKRKGFL